MPFTVNGQPQEILDPERNLLEFLRGARRTGLLLCSSGSGTAALRFRDGRITGSLDGSEVCAYQAERPLDGYLGLWTKADSVTLFRDLAAQPPDRPACLLG